MKRHSFPPSSGVNFSPRLYFPWFLFLFLFLSEIQFVKSLAILKQGPNLSGEERNLAESKSCDFNNDSRDHSISDFLRCTDALASYSPHPQTGGKESSKELHRIFENNQKSEGRQGFGLAELPYDVRPQGPFYGGGDGGSILDSLGGGYFGNYGQYGNYGFPGPFNPLGSFNLGLIEALTSISQYDDLKCVPRLICEIATGSRPGNGDEYKASNFENFGKNTLLGLLTSYNFEGASPVLAFGKAALLGYTNRGDPSICYEEYYRCPSNPRDLVYYLNNHNGGFFRFFKNSRAGRPVSQPNRIGSKRVGFSIKNPAPPPGLSGPESDRTGTGELKFDAPEPSPRFDGEKDEIKNYNSPGDDFSRIIFPREVNSEGNRPRGDNRAIRFSKSLKTESTATSFFPSETKSESESESSETSDYSSSGRLLTGTFFPSDYEEDLSLKTNIIVFEDSENGDPSYSVFDKRSIFKFPDRK